MLNKQIKKYEISDSELEAVNGGYYLRGDMFDSPADVVFRFAIGEKVEYVVAYIGRAFTKQCTIIERKVGTYPDSNKYCAWYKVSCSNWLYNNEWYPEKEFERGFKKVDTYNDL